jgi:hypothetical protein
LKGSCYIKSFAHIKQNTVSKNGTVLFKNDSANFNEFSKAAYKKLELKYPKFFKMDGLSKLAFIAADVLLKNSKTNEDTAIVLSNKASSLDTDRKHQKAIADPENYFPSPAIFVYTLPNICIGEISIKHKLFSENSFFIFDRFNADYLYDYAENLLRKNKAHSVLCGWVDLDHKKYEAFMYLVSLEGTREHTIDEIIRLYNYE